MSLKTVSVIPPSTVAPPSSRWTIALLALLMAAHFLLVCDEIIRSTPTLDEVAHLPAGQTYLEKQTFRMYRHSPPLARLVAAAVAWPTHPDLLYDRTWKFHEPANHWAFAFEVIAANATKEESRKRYIDSFTYGRYGIAVWSMLTIPFLYWWGANWFGRWSGLLAATLWTFSPNILAHAGLVTTDLAATSAGFIASFFFSRWLERPTWSRFGIATAALGLAQLVKFSSLWLYFIFAFWLLSSISWERIRSRKGNLQTPTKNEPHPTKGILKSCLGYGAMVLLSFIVIDVGYLFEGVGTPLGSFPFLSESLTRARRFDDSPAPESNNLTYRKIWQVRVNRFQGTPLAYVPCPLPYHFVAGFDEQKFEAEGKYPMYLRGEFAPPLLSADARTSIFNRRGWWYYYFYALAVKSPLSTMVLIAFAVALAIYRPATRSIIPLLYLAFVPILAMSFFTDINLGLRYVLASLPFLFVVAGSLVTTDRPRWVYWVTGLALGWNLVVIARIHPHELSYFNEVVGGPTQGRYHLIDSNIDWGQDLRGLARWLDQHPEWKKDVRIGYAGTISPEFEGIDNYHLAPRDLRQVRDDQLLPWEKKSDPLTWGPLPGKYAISVNFERGMRFHTPCPLRQFVNYRGQLGGGSIPGSWMVEIPRESYSYFQQFTPKIEPSIGYSILLYDVSKEEANRVRQQMGLPLLP